MSGTVCLQSSMRGWAREVGEVTTSRRGRGGDAAPRGVVCAALWLWARTDLRLSRSWLAGRACQVMARASCGRATMKGTHIFFDMLYHCLR